MRRRPFSSEAKTGVFHFGGHTHSLSSRCTDRCARPSVWGKVKASHRCSFQFCTVYRFVENVLLRILAFELTPSSFGSTHARWASWCGREIVQRACHGKRLCSVVCSPGRLWGVCCFGARCFCDVSLGLGREGGARGCWGSAMSLSPSQRGTVGEWSPRAAFQPVGTPLGFLPAEGGTPPCGDAVIGSGCCSPRAGVSEEAGRRPQAGGLRGGTRERAHIHFETHKSP